MAGLGLEYRGSISKTASGVACQRWDSQTPHQHNLKDEDMPGGSLSANENYCRNPDSWISGLWCYSSNPDANPEYEVCDIPLCPEGQSILIDLAYYVKILKGKKRSKVALPQ